MTTVGVDMRPNIDETMLEQAKIGLNHGPDSWLLGHRLSWRRRAAQYLPRTGPASLAGAGSEGRPPTGAKPMKIEGRPRNMGRSRHQTARIIKAFQHEHDGNGGEFRRQVMHPTLPAIIMRPRRNPLEVFRNGAIDVHPCPPQDTMGIHGHKFWAHLLFPTHGFWTRTGAAIAVSGQGSGFHPANSRKPDKSSHAEYIIK